MRGHDIIVIGASAGGVEALHELVGGLPADLPAAVLAVLHTSPRAPSMLPRVLGRRAALPVVQAEDGAPIERGRVYVAPPDFHLLVRPGRVELSHGPRENGVRPAVDPLFRSAAQSYGRRTVGVVLTGSLDDGTAGLRSIRRHGGATVAQDPDEAAYPGMPLNAIERVGVDHVARLARLPALLRHLARGEVPVQEEEERMDAPDELEVERALATDVPPGDAVDAGARHNAALGGRVSAYTCPECSGALWEIDEEGISRYRCRVGHAYTEHTLHAEQADALESAIWTALTALEEHAAFTLRMAERADARGDRARHDLYLERARLYEQRAQVIRTLLDRTTFTVGAEVGGA